MLSVTLFHCERLLFVVVDRRIGDGKGWILGATPSSSWCWNRVVVVASFGEHLKEHLVELYILRSYNVSNHHIKNVSMFSIFIC